MQYQTFQQGMALLAAGFQVELEAANLAVYWDRLKKRDDVLFVPACQRLLDESERFPSVHGLQVACDQEWNARRTIEERALASDEATNVGGAAPPVVVELERQRRAAYEELCALLGLTPSGPDDAVPPPERSLPVVFRQRFGIEIWQVPWRGGDPFAAVQYARTQTGGAS